MDMSRVMRDLQKREYSKFSLFQILKLMLEVWISYWEYFCYLLLIIYQIKSQGLLMIIIPFAVFGYALTEETRPRFRFWSFIFCLIVSVVLLKFFYFFLMGGSLSPAYTSVTLISIHST